MVCMGVAECQHVHRTALDYFLAVLIVVAAVVAVRLLICALVRCLKDGCVAHHHHHHSPASTDTDEDMEVWAGTELGIHRHADRHGQQGRRPEAVELVVPPPVRTTA